MALNPQGLLDQVLRAGQQMMDRLRPDHAAVAASVQRWAAV